MDDEDAVPSSERRKRKKKGPRGSANSSLSSRKANELGFNAVPQMNMGQWAQAPVPQMPGGLGVSGQNGTGWKKQLPPGLDESPY